MAVRAHGIIINPFQLSFQARQSLEMEFNNLLQMSTERRPEAEQFMNKS